MKKILISVIFAVGAQNFVGAQNLVPQQAQTIIYVKPGGTGDGSSWANACDLDVGARHASPVQATNVQIWVQKGTYYPSAMLFVPNSVKMYGGFNGTETQLSQRDSLSNATIIDGQHKIGSVVRLGDVAELNGFVIQNGHAKSSPLRNGGGVFAENNTVIANCVIRNNYAIVNGGGIYGHGALYLINSIVEDNTAGRKGPNIYGCCIDMEGGGCIAPFICADLPKSEESREYTVDTFEYKTLMVNVVGSETFSYQWYVTKTQGSTAGGVKVGINSPYYTPLGGGDIESPLYYYCVVTNDCGSDTSNVTGARTTSPPCYIPQITAQLNTDVQNRDQNVAFNALTVTATGDTPLTYQWYSCTSPTRAGSIKVGTNSRSYRPSSAVVGTLYYYCVVTNDCGTITSNVSGSHTVIVATGCVDETFNFGTVSFASANTRTITGTVDELSITQVWSDAVTATGCQKTAYNGGSSGAFKIDCRSNPSYPGDLFSWCAVVKYASTLCPAPWRVPTKDDFINLDKALGGTGSTRGTSSSELLKYFGTDSNQWGAAYGGYANADGTLSRQGSEACYRSQTEYSAGSGYYLDLHSSGSIYPQDNNSKYYGFSLRCVR